MKGLESWGSLVEQEDQTNDKIRSPRLSGGRRESYCYDFKGRNVWLS
jgi:hypothetical protein